MHVDTIPIKETVGKVLFHDVTKIVRGESKAPCSFRLLTGEKVTREDIIALAHGGLCRACPECRYPHLELLRAAINFEE
jgi:hypothetical protein